MARQIRVGLAAVMMAWHLEKAVDIEPLGFLAETQASKWNSLRPESTLAGVPV